MREVAKIKTMGEKVLVTGGLGFIGSHLVDELVKIGCDVSVMDIKNKIGVDYVNSGARHFAPYDIRQYSHLKFCFESAGPFDCIFHCAAMARIQPSFKDPQIYFDVNVSGTQMLLEFCRSYGAKKIIFSGSSSVYGGVEKMPLRVTTALQPLNFYAVTKQMGEILVQIYAKSFGVPGCVLRYFNVYGPRQPSEGEYATVIGIFLEQKKRGEAFTVVGDGFQRRDFTWVGDVVKANILAWKSSKTGRGEVLNIGSGKSYQIIGLTDIIDNRHPRVFIGRRPGEAKESLADVKKTKKVLGWTAETTLLEGIAILKKEMGL